MTVFNSPHPRLSTRFLVFIIVLPSFLFSACSSQDEEIENWISDQEKLARPRVETIPAPRRFVPQPYEGASGVDPFSAKKLVTGTTLPSEKSNSLLMAERQRRKEPLEAFPLDAVQMVGSVRRADGHYALLRIDSMLHYVTLGNYIGQNFGKITAITETDITLREIVQDAAGEWVERSMSIQLQELAQ